MTDYKHTDLKREYTHIWHEKKYNTIYEMAEIQVKEKYKDIKTDIKQIDPLRKYIVITNQDEIYTGKVKEMKSLISNKIIVINEEEIIINVLDIRCIIDIEKMLETIL